MGPPALPTPCSAYKLTPRASLCPPTRRLTKEQADELTSTPAPIAAEVTRWATSTGAKCARLSEALSCSGKVSQIEALLGGELSYFVGAPPRPRALCAALSRRRRCRSP